MSYGPAEFAGEFAVSRETIAKLGRYADLLNEWQAKMNLVGPSTLPEVWSRHFRDSAQLAALVPSLGHKPLWLDIGAGGGFPGLVLAAMGVGRFNLVESIAKKCRFLQTVVDDLELGDIVTIHNARVEALPRFRADLITARACANLAQLFDWGLPFAASSTTWLLPKGASVGDELTTARQRYRFTSELVPSRTDEAARIVIAKGVQRR